MPRLRLEFRPFCKCVASSFRLVEFAFYLNPRALKVAIDVGMALVDGYKVPLNPKALLDEVVIRKVLEIAPDHWRGVFWGLR